MSVNYHVDTDDADRELRRLSDTPDTALILRFEAVLTAQFLATQQHVHVITGSLKASGRLLDSDTHGNRWESGISYGGPAPGHANDPVDYAEIEQGRAPGGQYFSSERGFLPGTDTDGRTSIMHDYMAPVGAFEHRYGAAIMDFMRGDA